MKKFYLLIVVCVAVLGSLAAQTMWPEEAILRASNVFEWNSVSATSADGGVYTLTLDQVYYHRNLNLHKVNADGSLAWPQPIVICGGDSQKSQFHMFGASDGNYFIHWKEGADFRLTKVNPQGQPVWNPAIKTVYRGGMLGSVYKADNNGGAYLFYGKTTENGIVDIWGQHVDANGNNLFPGDGVEIAADPRQEGPGMVDFTPDGSILFSYAITESSPYYQSYSRLMLLNGNFVPLWQVNIDSGTTGTIRRSLKHMYPISGTDYNLIWVEEAGSTSKLYLNRINLQGSFVLPQTVVLAENNINTSISTYATQCSDNSLVMSIHFGSNMLPTSNWITKLSPDGSSLWANEVTLPDSVIAMSLMRKDDSDGVDFLIRHLVNGSTSNNGYALQHYSNAGVPLYPGSGIALVPSMPSNSSYAFSLKWHNQYFMFWKGVNQDKYGVYYNLRNAGGELIGESQRTLREGLQGNATLLKLQKRTMDVIAIWKDTRNSDGYNLYYQIVNSDGSFDLESGGRLLLSLPSANANAHLVTSYLADGSTWIFYNTVQQGTGYLMGQAISEAGDILYPETGHVFQTMPDLQTLDALMGYTMGNATYLAWVAKAIDGYTRTYLQKIENGQTQWGPSGMLSSPSALTENLSEYPICFEDGFIVLSSFNSSNIQKTIWVQHYEPSGAISPNWDANGLTLCSYLSSNSSPTTENAAVISTKLLFCYSRYDQMDGRYRYYQVDSFANILESNQILQPENECQSKITFDTTTGYAYTLNMRTYETPSAALDYNKMNINCDYSWSDLAGTTVDAVSYTDPAMLISGFPNGAYALSWRASDQLYLRYVTQGGNLHGLYDGQFFTNKVAGYHKQAVLNNELYLAWPDFKSGYYVYNTADLRMQKLGNITDVAVSDNYVNAAPLAVSCYPNPFSQSSNISFKLVSPENCALTIYNLRGQLIKTLLSEAKEEGSHSLSWDGTDSNGNQVCSGVYFIRLKAGNQSQTAKLLRVR